MHSGPSFNLEAMGQRIAIVDKDRVMADDARPATDARPDAGEIADPHLVLDPALEDGADQALLPECLTDAQPAFPCSCAMRADVPVPPGDRSIALSP